MSLDGRLKSWDDARGFGFIAPSGGGADVFVHISAFPQRTVRPEVGEWLWFEVEPGERGRLRARNVRRVGSTRSPEGRYERGPGRRSRQPAPPERAADRRAARSPAPRVAMDPATMLVIPAFAILYLLVTAFWPAPAWLPGLYAGASIVAFAVYAADKAAARGGRRRTPESTLHLLAFAGGWPGALLAQAVLRHKSAKVPFRTVFWVTVVGNVAVAVFLLSPPGRVLSGG